MSERLLKITTAQAQAAAEVLPAIGEAVSEAGKAAKGLTDKANEIGGENHRGDKTSDGDDFINDLNMTQQAAREQLMGYGLDKDTVDAYAQKLINDGMPSYMNAAKFLQDLASVASSSATTFQDIFPVAEAIYMRNPYSPDRAIAIMRTIAKYEGQVPGLGLFNMAKQAALGQFNPQALAAVRYSLMGAPGSKGNMNQSRDLQQAFDGINAPNSTLGAELNETNLTHQRMQATHEAFLMQMNLMNLEIRKIADKKLHDIYSYLNQNLPEWVKTNTLGIATIMKLLRGVAMANALKDTALHGLGVGGKTGLGNLPKPNTVPGGFIGAESTRVRKVVAQNQPGAAPQDLSAPPEAAKTAPAPTAPDVPTQPDQTQQISQNMQQANQGVTNNIAQMGLMVGVWNTQVANEVQRTQSLIETTKAALDTNFKNLTEMLEAGWQPRSQFDQEFATGTYVTPEQIQAYSVTADKNAQTLVQLIQSLLTIFVGVASSVSPASLNQSGVGIVQFMANLRNLEANYRAQLKEAQEMRIKIFDISIIGPIDQQVRVLEPTYRKLKAGMEMMAAFNYVGADAYVMPFSKVALQMAQLYGQAAQMYRSAVVKIQQTEPAMAQYCKSRADQMEAAAQMAQSEGVVALRNLMKQQSGGAIASTNDKFVRLSEKSPEELVEKGVKEDSEDSNTVEAKPMKVDEYWDKLYDNEPPYGDVMVHPEEHRNEPTWKMKPKHRIRRLN